MRKVIHKRVRVDRDGLNVAADIDAVIAINSGQDGASSQSVSHSSHVVAQSASGKRASAREPSGDPKSPQAQEEDA